MALHKNDHETIRRYLLGDVNEEEETTVEQRLLLDDGFFQELEIIKAELVDEYVSKQLTAKESEWFERNFLASPEGKKQLAFGKTFKRYVSSHSAPKEKSSWTERVGNFWNNQTNLLKAAAAFAGVVLVVGLLWTWRPTSPQTYATTTLTSSSTNRADNVEERTIQLKEDALRATLTLPSPATSGMNYRANLLNKDQVEESVEIARSDAESVTVEIPAKLLPPGRYVIQLYAIDSGGRPQRIPGNFHFTVE